MKMKNLVLGLVLASSLNMVGCKKDYTHNYDLESTKTEESNLVECTFDMIHGDCKRMVEVHEEVGMLDSIICDYHKPYEKLENLAGLILLGDKTQTLCSIHYNNQGYYVDRLSDEVLYEIIRSYEYGFEEGFIDEVLEMPIDEIRSILKEYEDANWDYLKESYTNDQREKMFNQQQKELRVLENQVKQEIEQPSQEVNNDDIAYCHNCDHEHNTWDMNYDNGFYYCYCCSN